MSGAVAVTATVAVGDYFAHRINGDRYCSQVVSIMQSGGVARLANGVVIKRESRDSPHWREAKQNEKGNWVYRLTSKYAHLSTWTHNGSVAVAEHLDPHF